MKKFITFLSGVALFGSGVSYGLLFAKRSGRSLRRDLKKSQNPLQSFWDEFLAVHGESLNLTRDWAEDQVLPFKEWFENNKEKVSDFVEKVKMMSAEAQEDAREALEELALNAQEAASELKKNGTQLQKNFQKEVQTIARKIKR